MSLIEHILICHPPINFFLIKRKLICEYKKVAERSDL